MKEKEYHLKTIQDILDVLTMANLDNFKKDFNAWLDVHVAIKISNELFKESMKIQQINHGEMIWIDDGKNEQNYNITIKK